jgi:hypothetical protein
VQDRVDSLELSESGRTLTAVVSKQLANDGPVLLFNMSLVILVTRAAARKSELLCPAVSQEVIVDELTTVFRVQPQEREGQALPDPLKRSDDGLLPFVRHNCTLSPAGRHIGNIQVQR